MYKMKDLSSIIIGIILAIITYIPLEIVKEETKIYILSNLLSAIGGVYFGFSLAEVEDNTNVWNLFDIHVFIESISVIIMIMFSIKGIQKKSYNMISLGYIFHGIWDIIHLFVLKNTKVPSWYIPFCSILDFVLGFIIYIKNRKNN